MGTSERTQQDLPACARLLEVVHRLRRYPMTWPDDPQDWLCPRPTDVAWWRSTGTTSWGTSA